MRRGGRLCCAAAVLALARAAHAPDVVRPATERAVGCFYRICWRLSTAWWLEPTATCRDRLQARRAPPDRLPCHRGSVGRGTTMVRRRRLFLPLRLPTLTGP